MCLTLSHASQSGLPHLAGGLHDCVWSATQAGRQASIAAAIGAQRVNVTASLGQAGLGGLGWVVGVATIGALGRYS